VTTHWTDAVVTLKSRDMVGNATFTICVSMMLTNIESV